MFKKIGIAAVVVVAGLMVLNHTKLGSWVGFAWKNMKEKVQSSVPPEVEIERLKFELTQLDPEIRKNKDQLAKSLVDLADMKENIIVAEGNLQKRYDEIVSAKKEVDGGAVKVSYNGRSLPAKRVKELVVKDFEGYKNAKGAVEAQKKLIAAKETAVEEARSQIANWQTDRDTLKAQIDQLEAELKTIQMLEAKHEIYVDNTRMNRFKESLKDLRHTIKVRTTRLHLEGETVSSQDTPAEKTEAVERAWNEIGDEKSAKIADSK
jgi:chromosome segregation ATPase